MKLVGIRLLLALTLSFVGAAGQLGAAEASVQRLVIQPDKLDLNASNAWHGILVTAVTRDGRQQDVTSSAILTSGNPAVAAVEGASVRAVAEGSTTLQVAFGGQAASLPVNVQNMSVAAVPSFVQDVIPLFTKLGCNQGSCHGKGAGQNGFRLSLRGYAPDWDHGWVTREFANRRVSETVPEESLLLRKPLGEMPHAGGRVLQPGGRAHQVLLDWIRAGSPKPLADEPRVASLQVLPGNRTLRVGDEQRLLVQAAYTDGTVRDVTWMTQFDSNDVGLVEVDAQGRLRVLRQGETAVRASFHGLVAVLIVTVPFDREIPADLFARRNNVIDEHVMTKLAGLRIEPSELSTDAEFVRRVFLDATGTLPTPEHIRAFLADTRADKRAVLIDQLLGSPEFVDFWTLQMGDLFQNRKERDHDVRGTKGVRAFHEWLRQQVAANRPWNELVRDVLTAQGTTAENPAVGYFIVTVGERQDAERSEVVASVAQAFLGTRIGCAQCHNHPLEKYTQDDYYHFAAYFARVKFDRKAPDQAPTRMLVATGEGFNLQRQIEQVRLDMAKPGADEKQRADREKQLVELEKRLADQQKQPVGVSQPRTGAFLAPQPLDRSTTTIEPGSDPRIQLARWMTDPSNAYFSGAIINRVWKHYLGVGIVEPVDDLRASNPPTNPQLWQALNRDFVAHGFDLRHLMRLILSSRTYQLASATRSGNATDTRFFSHYYARRLPAEVFLDALSLATGVPDQFPGYPRGVRAIQVPDPSVNSYFLSLFGRSERVTACACERQAEVTLPQLLQLQNGESVIQKMQAGEGRLQMLLQSQPDDRLLTEDLFLATLCRSPTEGEWQAVQQTFVDGESRDERFRDLFWALLNSKDFAFNH